MDGRISFHKLTITISASEAQKRLFSFEKFLIICPTTVPQAFKNIVILKGAIGKYRYITNSYLVKIRSP